MSNSSLLNSAGLVSSTPSTSTATEGSLLRACETPRTTTKALPAFCVSTSVMLGTCAMKSAGFWMPAAAMACSVNTFTVIGTSRKDSSRLRAVTTTSSRAVLSAASTGVATAAPTRGQTIARINPETLSLDMEPPVVSERLRAFDLSAHDPGAGHHGRQLRIGHIAWQVLHAAILRHDDVLGRRVRQRATDALG